MKNFAIGVKNLSLRLTVHFLQSDLPRKTRLLRRLAHWHNGCETALQDGDP
jgi:hypothetical protein